MRDYRQIPTQQWEEIKAIVLHVLSSFYTIRNTHPHLTIIQDAIVDMGEFMLRTLHLTHQMLNNLEQNKIQKIMYLFKELGFIKMIK